MSIEWKGVMPAITTTFQEDGKIDYKFTAKHVKWLVENGCRAIVPHGSLGEGTTLSFEEKVKLQRICVEAVGEQVPIIPGIAALTTEEGVALAQRAKEVGCKGLMVLPPYLYASDWKEMKAHMTEIIRATDLPCILYNNPVAYKTDFTPDQLLELARENPNVESVKESSTDVRRIAAIREISGNRLALGIGVDDCLVEGVEMGATFWIAGVVSALPKESVALFEYAMNGEKEKCFELYTWMLPLLRMDTVVKFVQLIKLIQKHEGWGNTRVRAPRLELEAEELEEAEKIIRKALENRPTL